MKNKKLNLQDVKVASFVTNINGQKSETVKGGTGKPQTEDTKAQTCVTYPHLRC